MNYYLADRKRNSEYTPRWMILKSTGNLQYKPIHMSSDYTSKFTGLFRASLNREMNRVWRKVELNKRFHLMPISDEEAARRIFLDT